MAGCPKTACHDEAAPRRGVSHAPLLDPRDRLRLKEDRAIASRFVNGRVHVSARVLAGLDRNGGMAIGESVRERKRRFRSRTAPPRATRTRVLWVKVAEIQQEARWCESSRARIPRS